MNTPPSIHRIGRWISMSVHRKEPWLAILAIIISVGSFIVSSFQYRAVTRHNRLSVKPHVNVIFYFEGGLGEKNGIYIVNRGLGPAIIKAISAEVGGKSYSPVNKHPWRSVLHDLEILPSCFKYGLMQPESALKSGEEFALLTVTHANPPIVAGRSCHIELLNFLKAEGLKVRIQYESMYGEPHERIAESPFDRDIMSDFSTAMMQQMAPKLAEQFQSMVAQLTHLADRLQQMHVNTTKHIAALSERILLYELYEDPPGAPSIWWLQK